MVVFISTGEAARLLGTTEPHLGELVRRGKITRAKAAELLGIPLWDFPSLLAQYRIPWFDYSPEQLEQDLRSLRA